MNSIERKLTRIMIFCCTAACTCLLPACCLLHLPCLALPCCLLPGGMAWPTVRLQPDSKLTGNNIFAVFAVFIVVCCCSVVLFLLWLNLNPLHLHLATSLLSPFLQAGDDDDGGVVGLAPYSCREFSLAWREKEESGVIMNS